MNWSLAALIIGFGIDLVLKFEKQVYKVICIYLECY